MKTTMRAMLAEGMRRAGETEEHIKKALEAGDILRPVNTSAEQIEISDKEYEQAVEKFRKFREAIRNDPFVRAVGALSVHAAIQKATQSN